MTIRRENGVDLLGLPASETARSSYYGDGVQSIADLTAIVAGNRSDKQLRFVEDTNIIYRFDEQSSAASNPPYVLVPDDSPVTGRWSIPPSEEVSHIQGTDGGANIFRVGSNAPYATVQLAVNAAEASSPTKAFAAVVIVPPGEWAEDVVVKHSYVHIVGVGGQGSVRLKSLTYTNATDASISAYEISDDPNDLVVDAALTSIPLDNQLRNIEVWNQVSAAQASLRFLGVGSGIIFLSGELLIIGCTVRASGPGKTGKAVDGCVANYFATGGYCLIDGEIRLRNVARFAPNGAKLASITCDYNAAALYGEPSDTANHGISGRDSSISGAVVLTNAGRIGGTPTFGHIFESTINATGTGVSDIRGGEILGNVSLGAGTAMTYTGGSLTGVVTGAGVFTRIQEQPSRFFFGVRDDRDFKNITPKVEGTFFWDDGDFGAYTIRKFEFFVDINASTDAVAVDFFDRNNAVILGSLTNITTSGLKSLSFSKPIGDTTIEIRLYKLTDVSSDPILESNLIELEV